MHVGPLRVRDRLPPARRVSESPAFLRPKKSPPWASTAGVVRLPTDPQAAPASEALWTERLWTRCANASPRSRAAGAHGGPLWSVSGDLTAAGRAAPGVPRASPAPPAFRFSERRHPDGREAVPRRGSDLRFPND